MSKESYLNYSDLWNYVVEQFRCGPYSIHGPGHWQRVERNGLILAKETGANTTVVRLFAIFHDSQRKNDHSDPGHGLRGAEFARQCRGEYLRISDEMFEQLYFACAHHTDTFYHNDITIGTCWDADRLDLTRVGIQPDPQYLNTEFAKTIAGSGNAAYYLNDDNFENEV